jgi:NADPH-dependent 2,4-dienoyl-CoA reductase/sulfur reductase-like enzyme
MVRTLINLINILLRSRANENNVKGPKQQTLKVGLVGAGIGGLAAAITIARAGADVIFLEAAPELGEV